MEQPISTPPVFTQTPVVPEPEKTKKSYTWLLILVLFLLAAGLSFFAWESYRLKSQLGQVQPSPSVEPLPSPSADPTANWLTYTNNVHKISFKYPTDWQLDQTGDSEPINARARLNKDNAEIALFLNVEGIGGQGQTYQGEPMVLDGNNFYQYRSANTYMHTKIIGITDSLSESLGFFKLNGKTYSISLSYPDTLADSEQITELETEFDLILSTFKFSDQSQAIDISNWETYTARNKYSFSFKYEPGGKLSEGNNPGMDIIHVVYEGKQLDWFIDANQDNSTLEEYIQSDGQSPDNQDPNVKTRVEENKTIGQLTGTYIVFPEAQRGQYDFQGPSIHFYFQKSQTNSMVHWLRLSFNKENLNQADEDYFEAIIKSVSFPTGTN